jgi:hypothetical protein
MPTSEPTTTPAPISLGVTVMPEWFQCEGIEPVLDRLQSMGATALVTSPYLLEIAAPGEGAREPPPDGEAGAVRPLDRALWGRRETWVRTAPCFEHDLRRYAGLRYQPSPPGALTRAEPRFMDRVVESARARGLTVYLQVMAASPPGYRVQFSSAVREDQCLGPDGALHPDRVDRNASLASADVRDFGAALLSELAERYPGAAGLRIDWPEYPPYDLRSALFDFSAHGRRELAAQGADPDALASSLRQALARWRAVATACAPEGAAAVRRGLQDAGWDDWWAADGPARALWASKRSAVAGLLRHYRQALDGVPGARRRLEPQVFPAPLTRWSGFAWEALADTADAVGVKLYTMHWPMIARYWARDLLGTAEGPQADAVTQALHAFMDFGAEDLPAEALRYPPPDTPHPVSEQAQAAKLRQAWGDAGACPVTAYVHSYGPADDVRRRFELTARAMAASPGGRRLWINRYGYLSDEKIRLIGDAVRSLSAA